jgi:hypothetical protein
MFGCCVTNKKPMSVRPTGTPASPVAPDRLSAVLAAGLRFGPPKPRCCATGVVFTRPPPVDQCAVCVQPLYGCASSGAGGVADDEGGDYRPVDGSGVGGGPCLVMDVRMRRDPDTGAQIPVVALRCTHHFHLPCIAGVLAAGTWRCPTCRVDWSQEEKDDIAVAAAMYNESRNALLPQDREETQSDGSVRFYKRQQNHWRLVRIEYRNRREAFYEGKSGAERKVRVYDPSGVQEFYEGEKGAELLVRIDDPNEDKDFYTEGDVGYKQKVRYHDGSVRFYKRRQNHWRLVRIEYRNGRKAFYEGESGAELLVRIDYPSKVQEFYEGEQGAEVLVRIYDPNDDTEVLYEGERGAERKVRVDYDDFRKEFYEGEQGAERKVRIEYRNGNKAFYEGEKGAERLVRIELPDGEKQFYEGERGAERLVRIELPDGEKQFYEGERGAALKVRTSGSGDDAAAKRPRIAALAAGALDLT